MSFRSLFVSLICIIFALLICDTAQDLNRKNKTKVILITVESLRADMVTQDNCPHLLDATDSGYIFSNYRAISGWTGTNIVSLLSGLTPFESGVHTRGQSVDPSLYLPLKDLSKSGYSVTGLQPFMAMDIYQHLGVSVAETSPNLLLWLAKQKLNSQPFFLWYHYVHTHLPYSINKPLKSLIDGNDLSTKEKIKKIATQSAVHFDETSYSESDIPLIHSLQKASVKKFDLWFNKLWNFYHSSGLYRDTILVVTADHGEEHGERQMVGHASTTLAGHLHEEIVRIPLFIWLPEKMKPGKTNLKRQASHIDLFPSLYHLLNRHPPYPFTGKSLFAPDKKSQNSYWLGMTSSGGFAEPDPKNIRYHEYAIKDGKWKSRLRIFCNSGNKPDQHWLYDLENDPEEKSNLTDTRQPISQHHKQILYAAIANRANRPVVNPKPDTPTPPDKAIDNIAIDWVHPSASMSLSYKNLKGRFYLQWTGSSDKKYQLQYKAGQGVKAIEGTLEVDGNTKRFYNISKIYWQTWIVPGGPYQIRVREVSGGPWSRWIELEAKP